MLKILQKVLSVSHFAAKYVPSTHISLVLECPAQPTSGTLHQAAEYCREPRWRLPDTFERSPLCSNSSYASNVPLTSLKWPPLPWACRPWPPGRPARTRRGPAVPANPLTNVTSCRQGTHKPNQPFFRFLQTIGTAKGAGKEVKYSGRIRVTDK